MKTRKRKAVAAADVKVDPVVAIAQTLPDDPAHLLSLAMQTVVGYDAAVRFGDLAAMRDCELAYDAAVYRLNGDTMFGSMDGSNPDAGGIRVELHCAAAPGDVPMFGQKGAFEILIDGIPSLVVVDFTGGRLWPHLNFHVVDQNAFFISATGYRSHFTQPQQADSVKVFAEREFAALLKKNRAPIALEYRSRPDGVERPAEHPVSTSRAKANESGQLEFVF
jgi:hypothetical protein